VGTFRCSVGTAEKLPGADLPTPTPTADAAGGRLGCHPRLRRRRSNGSEYRANGFGNAAIARATLSALIQDFAEHPLARDLGVFASIGTLAILIAMIAAGIALRRDAGAPLSVAILLGLFGFLIGAHPPPFGPIALLCFAAAVVLFWRSQGGGLAARSPEPAQSG
jgi:hypothetical protein